MTNTDNGIAVVLLTAGYWVVFGAKEGKVRV